MTSIDRTGWLASAGSSDDNPMDTTVWATETVSFPLRPLVATTALSSVYEHCTASREAWPRTHFSQCWIETENTPVISVSAGRVGLTKTPRPNRLRDVQVWL
ncbi:MAG: hypothetical protein ABI662_09160, partial [Dermatophilaceae bacterium]